jgi:4-amino-4-deoxychorismate lyase
LSDVVDGRAAAWPASVQAALVHGDGVFRTLLAWDGQIVDAEGQFDVLRHDAARIGLAVPPLSEWLADSHAALGNRKSGAVRWWLARRTCDARDPPSSANGVRWVSAAALPARPAVLWTHGVMVALSPVAIAEQASLAGIKHLNRLPQILATQNWTNEQSEALMCDREGHLVCGTRTNLYWVRDGQLFTPLLALGGVAGWMRRKLITLCEAAAIPVTECRAHPEILNTADEVFLSNSLVGIWPVQQMAATRWAAPGPLTRRLAQALDHPLCRRMMTHP